MKNGEGKSSVSRLRVGAVQMRFGKTMEENLEKILENISKAGRRKMDVVLFPEAATTGYATDFRQVSPDSIGRTLKRVGDAARKHRLNVLIGSPVFKGKRLFNCLLQFDRAGKVAHCYAKCQLTPSDRMFFTPGNTVSLFHIDGVCATSIICHERRYPELVRLACMAGAQVLFHPNAGLDSLSVSKRKRGGNDGISIRAFENAIYYVFANSVGPQGGGKWSAGDSKIVAPDMRVLAQADNESESLIVGSIDLDRATRKYAKESMEYPKFMAPTWKQLVERVKRAATKSTDGFDLPSD